MGTMRALLYLSKIYSGNRDKQKSIRFTFERAARIKCVLAHSSQSYRWINVKEKLKIRANNSIFIFIVLFPQALRRYLKLFRIFRAISYNMAYARRKHCRSIIWLKLVEKLSFSLIIIDVTMVIRCVQKGLILYSRYEEFQDFAQVIINFVPIELQHLGRVQNSKTTPAFN